MNNERDNILEIQSNSLMDRLNAISPLIGNTPIMPLFGDSKGVIAKLEYSNFSGSIKDRATLSILKNSLENNILNEDSIIIESTSGNFGISLALFSLALGVKFIPVIDSNITLINRKVLEFLSEKVIEVTERDSTGGFLLNRIRAVEDYKSKHSNVFNPNQYENEYNYIGYKSMAKEIAHQVDSLDYIVIAVSTGGTIMGISSEIKKYFRNIKVIAVDVKGSLIFENTPQRRNLSGIGSSRHSDFIINCENIDEVLILEEQEIIENCKNMVRKDVVFAGASSGAAYAGAQKILQRHKNEHVKIMIICPDRGTSYINNVYDKEWCKKNY